MCAVSFKQKVKENDAKLECIFVSSDRSENDMLQYMNESHGDWLAIPWESPVAA